MKKIGDKSVLAMVLADLAEDARQENERTLEEILDDLQREGVVISKRALMDRLGKQILNGAVKMRKWRQDGHVVNLYSPV